MPRDLIDELFDELAAAKLPVPASSGVLRRGRQRRRRSRLMATVAGLAAVAVAAGSTVAIEHQVASGRAGSPATSRSHHGARKGRGSAILLPTGSGTLVLGVGQSGHFEFARTGGTATVELRGLAPLVAGQSLVASDPAGGWVVTYAAGRETGVNTQPERLATVSSSGRVQPFGPVFPNAEVTSIAVRPGGAAVAVAVSTTPVTTASCHCVPATIMLIPLPGYSGTLRSWSLSSATRTMVEDLSWAPGGTGLTYLPGANPYGGGFSGTGAATLDVTGPGAIAPAFTHWPPFAKGRCNMMGGTWSGSRYLALEGCSGRVELRQANVTTGAAFGPAIPVQGWGCPPPDVSVAAGGAVLVSYCGAQIETDGAFRYLPGQLQEAALVGRG